MIIPLEENHVANPIHIYIYQQEKAAQQALLERSAQHYAKQLALPLPSQLGLAKDDAGKPYFALAKELQFSLSHSGDYLLVALANQPLGIDLQQHTSCKMAAVAKRFFHPDEYLWLEQQGYGDNFFALWAAKESYVKYTGWGIDEHFRQFSVVDGSGKIATVDGVQLRLLALLPSYSCCVCAKKTSVIRLFNGEDNFQKQELI